MTLTLTANDVMFASKRSVDTNGRVFYLDGEVYRAITADAVPIYQKLLQNPLAQGLFDRGLIQTEVAPLALEGYALVLKHHKIPFVSYVTEWCGSMLKEAALALLDLSLALAEMGLELQDAHPWNILFDGTRPIFIDFSSIIPIQTPDRWLPENEFIGMFYNPLRLMAAGSPDAARALVVAPDTRLGRRITGRDVALTLLRERKLRQALQAAAPVKSSAASERKRILETWRERISALTIPLGKTTWSDYCIEGVDMATRDQWMVKRQSAYEAIVRCKPKTLLDIGSNTGWFSKLAAMQGARVIATDKDETSINKLFLDQSARDLQVLPLIMDFRNPTPAYGIDLRCAPAVERYKCEMILGLAIIHHLVFSQKLTFSTIVDNLANFVERWLLVEFIPGSDKHLVNWYNERDYPWYTTENFENELRQHFRTVERMPSNPEPRLMFLCER